MPLVYDTIEYQREECLEITGFEGSVKNLTIPEQIGGLAVRSIGRHAFERRADLQQPPGFSEETQPVRLPQLREPPENYAA